MPHPPESDEGHYEIMLQDGQQTTLLPASVDLFCRDWVENSLRHIECRIVLRWVGGELQSTETDFFEAFCRIRERLAAHNLYPICYGADRRIVITGMARDMGVGLKVYKIPPDNSFSNQYLVDIFETGEDVEPVSVKEQLEFQQQWYKWRAKH